MLRKFTPEELAAFPGEAEEVVRRFFSELQPDAFPPGEQAKTISELKELVAQVQAESANPQ